MANEDCPRTLDRVYVKPLNHFDTAMVRGTDRCIQVRRSGVGLPEYGCADCRVVRDVKPDNRPE